MNVVETSYRCKVNADNRSAVLRIGRKNYSVEVDEISRELFSVIVPDHIANKIAIGKKGMIAFEGITWSVMCASKQLCSGNIGRGIGLELHKVAELTKLTLPKSSWWSRRTNHVHAVNRDPVLPVAMLVGFMVAILILPRSGYQWGLLEGVSKGFSGSMQSMKYTSSQPK